MNVHEYTLICDIHLHVKMQRYIMRSNMMGAGSENRIHTNAKDNQLDGLRMLEKVARKKVAESPYCMALLT